MNANPAIPYPDGGPHPFTLNDLRVHNNTIAGNPSSTSALPLYGLVVAVVLTIGAFIWLDPLRLFTPTEASPPAPTFVPSAEPARPTERQEIIAPLTPVPATKSVEVPIATTPVVQALHVSPPVVRPRAASIKPESRGNPTDKTSTTVHKASQKETTAPLAPLTKPEETTALPALLTKPEETTVPPAPLTKPEEKTDAPIVPKLGDDTENAPKPAASNDQMPVAE